jgi:hypothetical protein
MDQLGYKKWVMKNHNMNLIFIEIPKKSKIKKIYGKSERSMV